MIQSLCSLYQIHQVPPSKSCKPPEKDGSSRKGPAKMALRGGFLHYHNNVTIVKAEPKRVFFLPIFLMDIPPAGSLLSLTVIVQEPAVVLDYVGPKLAITMN